jgi:hypothetical protein
MIQAAVAKPKSAIVLNDEKQNRKTPSDRTFEVIGAAQYFEFAKRIKRAVELSGHNAKEVAAAAGIAASNLSGKRIPQGMSWWQALAIANATGVSIRWLLTGKKPERDPGQLPPPLAPTSLEAEAHQPGPRRDQPSADKVPVTRKPRDK